MARWNSTRGVGRRSATLLGVAVTASFVLAACGGSSSAGGDASATAGGSSSAAPAADKIAVSLITKDSTNPFFVAMQAGAKAAGEKQGVDITIASGKAEGDDQGQIDAIENAISTKQKGILITPMSTGVNDAIEKARAAGLFVIALDTPPDPADTVDITFATDNRKAGQLIGQYAAAALDGKKAVIALLDIFDDKVVSVDYNRDQGFLEGMGIPVGDGKKNGDEPKTGKYTGGKGGDYVIVGNEATGANEEGGQKGMENLLAKNPDINVVYTINEPTAAGADAAMSAKGKKPADYILVSVDGGKSGVEDVKGGVIDATSQQYPLKMAELGVQAIVDIVKNNKKPEVTPGLDFFDTGVTLIATTPMAGVDSKDPQYGLDNAWG
ncbi:substrate-binding domain-containing protein [Kineosporia sp. A_224]|uniref:substrate-binding domain-containing protein n=1 Tax=Kineosporia sp. A_224 TaxID=1962180 RepID=UPI000B4B1E7B|nr:substrate-binding domain-containing protein [Kineosporia sp. A_224]